VTDGKDGMYNVVLFVSKIYDFLKLAEKKIVRFLRAVCAHEMSNSI